MNEIIPYILAILAGVFTTLEASINSQLGKIVNPKLATFHSLLTGFLLILVTSVVSGTLKQYNRVFDVKLQWLVGGIFGALIVYLVTKTVPRLGITVTLTLVIAAQFLSSFFIDIFVYRNSSLEVFKLFGAILVITGIFFMVR